MRGERERVTDGDRFARAKTKRNDVVCLISFWNGVVSVLSL